MPPTGAATNLNESKYHNWLKASLALYYLKDGLHSFIQGEVDDMHQSLLQKLYGNSVVPKPQCSSCKSKDVRLNRNTYIWKLLSPCPSGLCDVWLKELLTLHTNPTSNKIYWDNCHVTAWPFVPWECAKLYMPRGQPRSNTGPAMSDVQSLLTLMANCSYFHGKLSPAGLTLTHKVSKIRNIVMHSGEMKLSDGYRKSFIQDIIHLLEDPTHLISLKECKEAVAEINKINDDDVDFFNLDLEMKTMRECIYDYRKELGFSEQDLEVMVESSKGKSTKLKDSLVKVSRDLEADLSNNLSSLLENINLQLRKLKEVFARISEAQDQILIKNIESGVASTPHIPDEIQSMPPEAVELYLNILETGVERRKNIRLMLVGLYNTGKTSLACRLMGRDVQNTESTDGIQIYRGRCKISLDDGSWTTSESDVNEDASSRLVMLAVMRTVQSMEKRILKLKELSKEDTVVVGNPGMNDSLEENPSVKLDQAKRPKMISSLRDPSDIRNIKKLEQRLKCSTPEQAVQKKDEAIVNLWDFAGQFAYYSTHQLFLSPRAIYIVVFKLTEDMKDLITNDVWFMDARGQKDLHIRAGCMFWLKSIYHYGQSHSMQRNVILVGTHKDKLEGSEDDKEQHIERTFESIHKMLTDSEVAEIVHEKIFAVSNLVDDQSIQELRQTVLEIAKAQVYWDEELPAKWIQLEGRLIDERAKKKCMLSFQEMLEIDQSCTNPMGDADQLRLFLIYQTQIGNLIFINEYPLQDAIVLDPQWIADAFCSAVADTQFARKFGSLRDAWAKMMQTAIMEESLLAKLWSEKNQHDFVVHEKKLVQYMEKLNMMAKIKVISDDGVKEEELPQYFIPCLLKECPDQSIGSCPNEEYYARTAILCFEFGHHFLPPPVFHRLLSACIAKWPVAKQGGKYLLFCGYGVFEIRAGSNRCRLTIQHLDDIIAVRMSSVSTGTRMLDAKFCDKVRRFIKVALNKEFHRFRKQGHGAERVCQSEEAFKQKILCPIIKDIHLNSDIRCGLISVEDVVNNHIEELYSCAEHSDMSYPHDVKIKDILQHWFPDELASVAFTGGQGQHWCLDVQEDRIVSEKELGIISGHIGRKWEFLGRVLEVTDAKLEQIKDDYRNTRECIYQMLRTWKGLSGEKATISELMSAIQQSGIVVDKDSIKNILDGTESVSMLK